MCWEDDDKVVKALIMSLIPDELFNWIKSGVNAQAWWVSLPALGNSWMDWSHA